MNKPKLTMIEFFSGIGAQKRGVDNTELYDLDVVATSDVDKEVMIEYAAIHHGLTNEMVENYEGYPSREEMVEELKSRNIGMDFDKGKMFDWDKLIKKKTKDLEKYWLAMTLQNNLGDISKIEQAPTADCWFYSSPCQCFSVAGKQDGIDATCNACGQKYNPMLLDVEHRYICPNCGSDDIKGTRSGLLLEIERLLIKAIETNTAPKYLCLENVKNLVGKQFKPDFDAWVKRLEYLGYNTYWEILNAKECGVPQNRERVFAFSIRKDIDTGKFTFPLHFDTGIRLKDILEKNVEEKYYINTERASNLIQQLVDKGQLKGQRDDESKSVLVKNQATEYTRTVDTANTLMARDWKGFGNQDMIAIVESENLDTQKRLGGLWDGETTHQAGSVWDSNGMSPTLDTCGGGGRQPHIIEEENNDIVQWKDIDDFPYQISEYGEIKNINTGYIRSLRKDKDGYLRTDLCNNGIQKTVRVHRLVAEYFLPKAECMECVNHKDGDIYNNHYSNLEWCSVAENNKHKEEILLKIGSKNEEPKGVTWDKNRNAWQAALKYHNTRIFIGRYINKSDAYKAVFYKFIELRGYMPWDENKYRTFLKDGESVEEFNQDDIREEKINKYIEETNTINQLGNYVNQPGRDNPQRGRVYDQEYIAPTLNCMEGGNLQPCIVENTSNSNQNKHSTQTQEKPKSTWKDINSHYKISSKGVVVDVINKCQVEEVDGKVELEVKGNMAKFPVDALIKKYFVDEEQTPEVIGIKQATKKGYIECELPGCADLSYPSSTTRRGRVQDNGQTSPTITATETGVHYIESVYRIRKLTVRECFVLMGFEFSDWDACVAVGISNSAGYKAAGNSIVTNCISLLFEHLYKAQYDESYICTDEKMQNFQKPQVD